MQTIVRGPNTTFLKSLDEKWCFYMDIEVAFGKVVREFRNNKELSQEELAHICNLDRTFISLLERGKRKPTINTVFALAAGLEILPRELIKETENKINKA